MKKKVLKSLILSIVSSLCIFLVSFIVFTTLLHKGNYSISFKDSRIIKIETFVTISSFIILMIKFLFKSSNSEKETILGKEEDTSIVSNLENSGFLEDKEIKKEFDYIEYSELENQDKIGIPILAKEEKTKVPFKNVSKNTYNIALSKMNHTLIIGTTGSGKTTSYISPSIEILSNSKSKPSLIIADVKGELYERHFNSLKAKGYKIVTFNLKEPYYSTRWNPLERQFVNYQKMLNLENEITKDQLGYHYNSKTYKNKEDVQKVVNIEKAKLYDEVYENLHDITSAICPVSNKDDPTWEKGASNFILGVELAMLEDSKFEESKMTKEKFNFYNVYNVSSQNENECKNLQSYFECRVPTSKARILSKQVLISADKTRDSYLTTAYSKLSMFADMGICSLTSKNEIDFNEIESRPVAVFLEIPDEKVTRHLLASLFINQAYKELVAISRENDSLSLNRDVVFILDEFGNLPKIDKIAQMVTVGRSRRIWFFLVVQSYTQLDSVYGEKVANIIKSNCNVQVFIGTSDQRTVDEFSKRCGNMSIIQRSYSSSLKGNEGTQSAQVTQRPIIYPSELQTLNRDGNMGNAIVTVFGYKPIKAYFTPCYDVNKFNLGGAKVEMSIQDVIDEEKIAYDIRYIVNHGKELYQTGLVKTEANGGDVFKKEKVDEKEHKKIIRNLLVCLLKKDYATGLGINFLNEEIIKGEYQKALERIESQLSCLNNKYYRQTRDMATSIESTLKRLDKELRLIK